jgi:DNA-binding transcriptional ArsR family regulator
MMVRTPSSSAEVNASAGTVVPAESVFPMPAWEPPALVAAGVPGSDREQVRLSLRLVVQLSWVGIPSYDGAARKESTQEGLSQALSVTQGAVSKVLRRLVAAEMVCRERRHVRGVDRRVRVYFLSRQGETLAREIRDRFGIPPRFPENR